MENVVTMDSVVTSLTTALSASNLWATVGSAVPLIAIAVLFALGFGIVRRVLKGTSKRKTNM